MTCIVAAEEEIPTAEAGRGDGDEHLGTGERGGIVLGLNDVAGFGTLEDGEGNAIMRRHLCGSVRVVFGEQYISKNNKQKQYEGKEE